jgi:transposase-like protein
MSILSQPQFHDEAAAFAYVEGILWPEGPTCPHCDACDRISAIKPNPAKKVRIGLKFCGHCRRQFTVRVGTIFEDSHLPMTKWLQAIFLMVSSKKGVSSHQLHRTLECTYKTAWFLSHRIREAMRAGELAPFGGGGGAVEVDETYIGFDPDHPVKQGERVRTPHKNKVISLVDRTTGRARSYVVDRVSVVEVGKILGENLSREAHLMTDQAGVYRTLAWNFAAHGVVDHSIKEYVNFTNPNVHTQTIEGYFSIFKRGMKGVYQHCGKKHLHRYMAEFDFRYSNRVALGVDDQERAVIALQGVVGRRLTYRRTGGGWTAPEAGA